MNSLVSLAAPHPLATHLAAADRISRRRVMGLDLAWVHDGCAAIVFDRSDDRIGTIYCNFRIPLPGQRFDPVAICEEYLDTALDLGVAHVTGDAFYPEIVRRSATPRGISFHNASSSVGRTEAFYMLRDYTRRRVIGMPRILADHLRSIRLVARAGGTVSIVAERSASRGHADLAFAAVAAAALDARMHGSLGSSTPETGAVRGGWTSP